MYPTYILNIKAGEEEKILQKFNISKTKRAF